MSSEGQAGKCALKPWQLRQHDEEILELRLRGWTLQKIADKFKTTREGVRYALARHLLATKKKGPDTLDGDRDQRPIPEGEVCVANINAESVAQVSAPSKTKPQTEGK